MRMTSLQISTNVVSRAHKILLSRPRSFLKLHHDGPVCSPSSRNFHVNVFSPMRMLLTSSCGWLRMGKSSVLKWSSRPLATKPKSSVQKVADKKEGQVGAAKKVVQAGKDVTYLGIIIVGVGVTALMFFTVGKELFSSKSPNVVYTRALKRCKNSDEVTSVFGLPLKGYGEMTRRKRRRHVSHFEYEKDGMRHMRVKFYIEGPDKKGTVNVEVREDESGNYEYRYLFVDVEGYPPQTIVIEDNR